MNARLDRLVGTVRMVSCRVCGKPGHNRRTCETLKQVVEEAKPTPPPTPPPVVLPSNPTVPQNEVVSRRSSVDSPREYPKLSEDTLQKIAWRVLNTRVWMKEEEFALLNLLRCILFSKMYKLQLTGNIHTSDNEAGPYFSAEVSLNPGLHYPIHFVGEMRGSRFIVKKMKVFFKTATVVNIDIPETLL